MGILRKLTKEDYSIGFVDSGLSITYRIGPDLHSHNLDMEYVKECISTGFSYLESFDNLVVELDYAKLAVEFSDWTCWSAKCKEEEAYNIKLIRKSRLQGVDLGTIEELADNLQLYVKQLYAIRASIQIGEQLDEDAMMNLMQDYEEAVEIKKMWDGLGEE